ncbi:MAG: hypothetical protein C0617_04850 [Desulfuromonas sp.]|uniref:SDR family NAD(P)-dependent oxidoreductase n=1 Tax=Desulfuromonas sp. TaxID=892 RepID=UPI000CC7C763|nr:SDR family oxidoreductase [Desulfuromonas sp.]PLX85219.1 MAG: hypothetical protein C0617_04850 [Desulfuromonas sp.]
MSDAESTCSYLITGVSSHLGEKLVGHLSEDPGNRVFTTSRGPSAFDQITAKPNHQHLTGVDLLQADDVSRLFSAVSRWAEGPFHVVNCVGYFPGYSAMRQTPFDEFRRVFECNVLTLYATANALLPLMQAKGGGHFMAFSSHSVAQAYPLMAAFTAAKAAVESLVRSIANEHAKEGIVANAFAIATINTPREHDLRPGADSSGWLDVEQISRYVVEIVRAPFSIMNGNTIHLYNYSDTFFHTSYFDRLGTTPSSSKVLDGSD